jgi:GGDEF domain-containing protein
MLRDDPAGGPGADAPLADMSHADASGARAPASPDAPHWLAVVDVDRFKRIGPLYDIAGAFDRADAAPHHAKQTGRNQVLAWEALVASDHLALKQSDALLELF